MLNRISGLTWAFVFVLLYNRFNSQIKDEDRLFCLTCYLMHTHLSNLPCDKCVIHPVINLSTLYQVIFSDRKGEDQSACRQNRTKSWPSYLIVKINRLLCFDKYFAGTKFGGPAINSRRQRKHFFVQLKLISPHYFDFFALLASYTKSTTTTTTT